MNGRWRRFILGFLLLLLAACRGGHTRPPFDPDDPQAMVVALRDHLRKHPDDTDAWRDLAHVYWLHMGQAGEAVVILDRLAKGGDPAARLSRMLIAGARRDLKTQHAHAEASIRAATTVSPGDPSRDLVVAAAEVAARQLADTHGDRAGDDDRYVAFYDALDPAALPFAVRQPLSSLRAAIARRRGEDYRPYYEMQGCAQAWQATAVIGNLGELELARLDRSSFAPDSEAKVVPLSCVVRVWNPTRRSGVRRLRTWLDVDGRSLGLNLAAEEAMRVWLDGRLIHRTDRDDHFVARRLTLHVPVEPGAHELEIATAVTGERSWILARVFDEHGRPVSAFDDPAEAGAPAAPAKGKIERRRAPWTNDIEPLAGPIHAPLRLLLGIEDALDEGDSDRAEILASRLQRYERFADGAWARARFERADPSRGTTVSAAREQRAIGHALALDAGLDAARLRLYDLMLARGDDDEVLEALDRLPKGRLRGLSGQMLRYRAHRSQGNDHLAEQALRLAAKRQPDSCRVLVAQRSMVRERNDVDREDELTKKLARCGGSLELRARHAETRGRYEEAAALWAEELQRVPDEIDALEGLARIAAVRGNRAEAEKRLQQVLALNPQRVGALIGLSDLAAAAGDLDTARAQIKDAIRRIPYSNALREAGETLGLQDDLMQWRVDGLAALADYRASGKSYEGVAEVLVLDRSVARVYPGGGTRQIVHLVVELLSKEALDRYGELSTPDGGRLLTLRTIKPDGSMLEPELVPGKDGVSLRNLEIGDVVEYEFMTESGPSSTLPGYVDISSFRFQSQDVPYHRSELLVVHPEGLKVREDRRNDPPVAEVGRAEVAGQTVVTRLWRAKEVPRLGVEPGHRPLLDELPSVRVYTDLDVEAWLDTLALNLRDAQRTNPQLRALVRRLTRGEKTDRDKLHALWRWVVENVEDGGDLSTPATGTLASRTGNRLMLLRSMLRVAGVRSELWLARDGFGPSKIPGGHPMVEAYEAAMLAVALSKSEDPLMVMTSSKVMPLGYLSPGYAGSDGLRVPLDPDGAPGVRVELPRQPPELADRRRYDLALQLDASGAGTVKGSIALQGLEALAWREALREIDRDRIEEMFQQAELGWLRGATLSQLDIENEKDLRKPLVLSFTASAHAMGVNQGGALVLRSSPMPLNPGARFTSLPRRTTGIVIPYAPAQEARIEYRLEGAAFSEIPVEETIQSAFGRYERKVVEGGVGKDRLILHYRSTLRPGIVEPKAYVDMAAFTREVEAAEQALIRAKST